MGFDLVGDPSLAKESGGRTFATTRDAVGAKVAVSTGGKVKVREVQGGVGFASQSDRRVFFGLGDAANVDFVEITWPDGSKQRIEGSDAQGAVDHMTRVTEGAAR
jgi:hypothetical protein